jgi:hypothetical protein
VNQHLKHFIHTSTIPGIDRTNPGRLKNDYLFHRISFLNPTLITHNIRFRHSGTVTALIVSCIRMMMIYSMAVLGSHWLCLPLRWVVCSWSCERHSCCLRSQLPSSPFVRSLSCLSSKTSTNKYCSLLYHDDFKDPL